jgi:hypothetical protein
VTENNLHTVKSFKIVNQPWHYRKNCIITWCSWIHSNIIFSNFLITAISCIWLGLSILVTEIKQNCSKAFVGSFENDMWMTVPYMCCIKWEMLISHIY